MDVDPSTLKLHKTDLLDVRQIDSSRFEFFWEIWGAAEALVSPDLSIRKTGLESLAEQNASQNSQLIAYLLYTRITEPDLELRIRVVKALAGVFGSENGHSQADEAVQLQLCAHLAQMQTRQIFALLQVVDDDPSYESMVADLLGHCSCGGGYLSEILMDRSTPTSIQKWAVHYIGQIGYLDAMPTLERLASRMEARNGKNNSLIDGGGEQTESDMLTLILSTLETLQAP